MWTKTTFWFAVLALIAVGSVVAVPLTTIDADAPGAADKDAAATGKPSAPAADAQQQPQQQVEQQVELLDPAVPPQRQPTEEATTVTDAKPQAADVEAVTEPAVSSPPGPVRGDSDNTGGIRPTNPAIPPFFLELLQPFQQPSRRYTPYHYPQQQQQQQPYPFAHVPVDPFSPFAGPIVRVPSFDQLFNVYNNEFRHMLETFEKGVSQMQDMDPAQYVPNKPIGKTTTKTEIIDGHVVQINETTYSNGDANHQSFYHLKEIQVLPEKPNKKIVSNEKIVSSVDNNSGTQKEETNEIKREDTAGPQQADAAAAVGTEDDKQNGLKKAPAAVSLDDHFQTAAATYYAPYSPYGPRPALYYPRPEQQYQQYQGRPPYAYHGPPPNHMGRPPYVYGPPPSHVGQPTAPVSLHGDTYVNQLAALQQQASGTSAVLPPDVELVDVHGKPSQRGGQYFYNNRQHTGGDKFPGRKH